MQPETAEQVFGLTWPVWEVGRLRLEVEMSQRGKPFSRQRRLSVRNGNALSHSVKQSGRRRRNGFAWRRNRR